MIQIQISRHSQLKLEDGILDRFLDLEMVENYGKILSSQVQQDGDLADCFIITPHVIDSGVQLRLKDCILLGMFQYVDKGQKDNKYLFCRSQDLKDLSFIKYAANKINCIGSYLLYYKNNTNQITKLWLSTLWLEYPSYIKNLQFKQITQVSDRIPSYQNNLE